MNVRRITTQNNNHTSTTTTELSTPDVAATETANTDGTEAGKAEDKEENIINEMEVSNTNNNSIDLDVDKDNSGINNLLPANSFN